MDNEPTNKPATDTNLSLTASDDKLELILETSAEYLSDHDIISEVEELAKLKGISVDIDTDCLRAAIEEARQNNTGIDRLVIARGRPPEQPRDASLEWARDFSLKATGQGLRATPSTFTRWPLSLTSKKMNSSSK
ncbi:MAG: hypothetical protein JSU74_00130 [Candidatus Zixiibacteriota bacterium]|nr:MAG: hypothetical protein JSU74_00130 [candidate division Zixibacteria bacterium]